MIRRLFPRKARLEELKRQLHIYEQFTGYIRAINQDLREENEALRFKLINADRRLNERR